MKNATIFFLFTIFSFFCQTQALSLSKQITNTNTIAITFDNVVFSNKNKCNPLKFKFIYTPHFLKFNTHKTPVPLTNLGLIGVQNFKKPILFSGALDLETTRLAADIEKLNKMTPSTKLLKLKKKDDQINFSIVKIVVVKVHLLQTFKNHFWCFGVG